jgi:hypothetical protein
LAGATGAAGAEATNEDGGEGRVKRQRVSAAAEMITEGNAEKVNAADADGEEGEDGEEDGEDDEDEDENGDDDENGDEKNGENDDSDEDSAEGRYWAALHAPHEPAWRFCVGDKVLVCVEDWEAGTVELRDESDPPGEVS